jgi:predicted membrane-bound mannosyltransferase
MCVVVTVLIMIAVLAAVGVSVGVRGGDSPEAAPAPSSPTEAPKGSIVSAAIGTINQSSRFLQFSEILGYTDPNTVLRNVIFGIADSDELQIDPLDQAFALIEQR